MEIPFSRLKIIAIICMFVIVGIVGSYFMYPIMFPSNDIFLGKNKFVTDRLPDNPKLIDVHYEIQEWDLSLVHNHNRTIIHVTHDELKEFPDFERALIESTTNVRAWSYGTRVVKWFDGNDSEYIRFHIVACKNQTLFECYPNPPVYEYNGQYYTISADTIGSHTTYQQRL